MTQQQSNQLAVICLGLALVLFAAFSQFKLPVVLPVMLDRYGYDPVLAGGFMSVYAALGIVLSIWIGRRVESLGPLTLVLFALPLMAAGTLVSLLAPQQGLVVLLGRTLEGAAFAILAVAGPALASNAAAPRQRALVMGLVATWMPAGQLLAALLAPLALATTGWPGLWIASIAMAAALTLWTWLARRAQQPGGAGSAAATPQTPPPRTLTRAQRQGLLVTAAFFMLWSGQYIAYMTWLPEYLVSALAMSVETALWIYLIPVIFVGAFNIITGYLLRHGLRPEHLLFAAVCVQALLWWLLPVSNEGAAGLVSLTLYGVTAGIAPTCLFALATVLTEGPGQTARAFGTVMTGRNLGVLLGPLLLAQMLKWSGDWIANSPVFGAVTSLAAVLALLLIPVAPKVRGELAATSTGGKGIS